MEDKDRIFEGGLYVTDFSFDETVAKVFSDMLHRSVPCYEEMQQLIVAFCAQLSKDDDIIVDLGCSHGATCINIGQQLQRVIYGIDNSRPLIEKAEKNLTLVRHLLGRVNFVREEITPDLIYSYPATSLFILSLTLQFIRPPQRTAIIDAVYRNLAPGGALILIEKTILPGYKLNNKFIVMHQEFKKRNGYTDTEIAAKRTAIENVLVPYSIEENRQLLQVAGFSEIATFFQWLNFSGMIAVK